MAKSRKHKKRSTRKVVKARAGSRVCHVKKRGRGFVLSCPSVAPIKLGIGFMDKVTFAPKNVARAAKAAPSTGTVVANTQGDATVVSPGGFTMPAAGVTGFIRSAGTRLSKKMREALEAAKFN